MRKSITSRIITSYLMIIFAALAMVGIVFSLSAKSFAEREVRNSLLKDAAEISDMMGEEQNSTSDATENKIRRFIREGARARAMLGEMENSLAIVNKDYRIMYPRMNEEAQRFRNKILPKLKDLLGKSKEQYEKIKVDTTEYLVVFFADKGNKGWVILYAPVVGVNNMSRGMVFLLAVSLVLASILAVIAGIFTARSIARPIITLKNRAESLSKRDFDSKVHVNTGDELEEFANTINRIAVELKEYDFAQKKFLQNASHELKTPLMSIQGYAEGLKDGVFEDSSNALDIIIEESNRLKKLVEELIFLSKLETMEDYYKYSEESLNDLVAKCVEKVNGIAIKAGKCINIALYKDAMMMIDRDKLTQALINILGNCIRYAKHEIAIATSNDGKNFEIAIRDDGEGFDNGEIANVFTRFYKGKKGNTGLGLAITKAIIEKHKGTIEACRSAAGGAEFRIRLPI